MSGSIFDDYNETRERKKGKFRRAVESKYHQIKSELHADSERKKRLAEERKQAYYIARTKAARKYAGKRAYDDEKRRHAGIGISFAPSSGKRVKYSNPFASDVRRSSGGKRKKRRNNNGGAFDFDIGLGDFGI